jgi:diguanylate cyclase (GGDEF)-like protein
VLASVPIAVVAVLALAVVGLAVALVVALVAIRGRDRALAELTRERARARTDALTGALNRHALEEALVSEQARVGRGAQPAAVFFLDADRFRDVNNRYGYETGDAVLVALYNRLRLRLRASDSVYRWGGEEFVVIAPEVGDETSLAAGAERLRRLFADEPLAAGMRELPVTVSIGAALLESGSDAFETLEHAGQLAKTAKQWRNTALVQSDLSTQAGVIQLTSWTRATRARGKPVRSL